VTAAELTLWLRTQETRSPALVWSTTALGVLAAALVAGVCLGPTVLSPGAALDALLDTAHPLHIALAEIRLPRVLAGFAVGAALATGGALLQAVVRNPLADPGILGVTAGAGLAALATIVLAPAATHWVPLFAFVGGLGELVLVLMLAWQRGSQASALRIVLTGVAMQALCVAGASILTFLFADRAPAFSAFLVGSLNGAGWSDVVTVWIPTALGIMLALASLRALNLLLLDEATAAGRGLDVRRTRFWLAGIGALLAAGAASVAGLVAFLVTAFLVDAEDFVALRLVTGPDHRLLIPLGAVAGGALVVVADAAARSAVAPLELPVGALLALVGGPYFLGLLWKKIP